ncbi:hypothetical protein [Cognatiluteimonas telluris]|jgi:hypothetical protein|uniref:hypothetical protein n=1 Tax=Cognatiluteimonas telluris TaxID=1104775 RepID=UPI00140D8BA0|nr:hypothetical protein [Lysobacter telluris]
MERPPWAECRDGARLARRIGTLGFLARAIAGQIPALMDAFGRHHRRTRPAQA